MEKIWTRKILDGTWTEESESTGRVIAATLSTLERDAKAMLTTVMTEQYTLGLQCNVLCQV